MRWFGLLGVESVFFTLFCGIGTAAGGTPRVDYSRDVRPILSNNCYQCHGPDAAHREAGLRLDLKDEALAELDSGSRAIVPGRAKESALVARIVAKDAGERMPPADSGKSLTPQQIDVLTRWIEQGAEWKGHWAFIPPERPPLPAVKHEVGGGNAIDRFIVARLEAEGLELSQPGDKLALIRRVTFDLTGLPPALAEIDAFMADQSPESYERLVDRLLASPRYGEHMTRYWLDAARYGDTHGLHLDNERSIWPYRDWLIGAFNKNLPFDQFTVEQLAGDMLPSPTLEQRVATGFSRCNVTTSEGGSIDEEYRVRYAVDRTETVGTVWMGLTVGCAVCHDHKFDPITQKEFYGLYSFFYSSADAPMDGNALLPAPTMKIAAAEQTKQQETLKQQVSQIEQRIKAELAKVEYAEPKEAAKPEPPNPQEVVWIDDDLPPGAVPASDGQPLEFVTAPSHPVLSGSRAMTRTAQGRSQHYFTGASPGLRIGEGDVLFAHVYLDPKNPPKEIMLQWNDGTWEHRATWGADLIEWGQPGTASRRSIGPLPAVGQWVRLEVAAAQVGLSPGAVINGWAFTQFDGHVYWDKAGVLTRVVPGGQEAVSLAVWEQSERATKAASLPEPVKQAVLADSAKRTAEQQKQVREHFIEHVYSKTRGVFAPLHAELAEANKKLAAVDAAVPATMVMQDAGQPRPAFVLKRGEYDKPGEKVDRGVPAVLPPLAKDAPLNRLGLARWLVDRSHPLTARVTVNRFWQQYFGAGLVKTAEDFGTQGEWPSHPELLDWLAVEFIASGWNVKQLQRLIVTSATYRQSSRVTPSVLQRDPENRLLARGPRFRMDAEMVRDNALAVSGLLNGAIGGRSVKPYQPSGLWEAVGYSGSNTVRFVQDHGDALYRRSMYTFWKRTAPPPTLLLLDAPSRETCTVRRSRTNTPLAALALLNDVQYFEAARKLAERMMIEGGATPETRITLAFRLATARPPRPDELAVLVEQYKAHSAEFQKNKDAARRVVSAGESKRNESLDMAELAAWTMVANVILNLDETLNKG